MVQPKKECVLHTWEGRGEQTQQMWRGMNLGESYLGIHYTTLKTSPYIWHFSLPPKKIFLSSHVQTSEGGDCAPAFYEHCQEGAWFRQEWKPLPCFLLELEIPLISKSLRIPAAQRLFQQLGVPGDIGGANDQVSVPRPGRGGAGPRWDSIPRPANLSSQATQGTYTQ